MDRGSAEGKVSAVTKWYRTQNTTMTQAVFDPEFRGSTIYILRSLRFVLPVKILRVPISLATTAWTSSPNYTTLRLISCRWRLIHYSSLCNDIITELGGGGGVDDAQSAEPTACVLLASCLAYSSTIMMEETRSSETSVDVYRTTWQSNPWDRTLLSFISLGIKVNSNYPLLLETERLSSFNALFLSLVSPLRHDNYTAAEGGHV
jgi:hypothetical protein